MGTGDEDADYDDAEVASLMKSKAEARRQRILKSSNRRMDIVSGATNNAEPASSSSPTENENASDETQNVPAKKTSAGNSRLQQMRRRRFKKASEAKENNSKNSEATVAPTSSEAVEDISTPKIERTQDTSKPEETNYTSKDEEKPTGSPPASTMPTNPTGEKKKYVGVARMRRKMLSERKLKENQETKSSSTHEVESISANAASLFNIAAKRQHRLSVFLQLLTAIMLFMAGLEFGWNNVLEPINLEPSIALVSGESKLVSLFYSGNLGQATTLLMPGSGSPKNERSDRRHLPVVDNILDVSTYEDVITQDEFSTETTATQREPIIDPIFKVDLDEFTKGDGIIFAAAGVAVDIHRFVIAFPVLLQNFIFQKIGKYCTPFLFLVALFLRRFMKWCGACDPSESLSVTEDGGGSTADNTGSMDIVGTVLKTAKAQVMGIFPRIFVLIEIIKDIRKDMYIVLCGLLVGVALPLSGFNHTIGMLAMRSDEL